MTKTKHPIQPIITDEEGVLWFKENRIICDLLDFAAKHGLGLNEIARSDYSREDRQQLAQLIGYSLHGYSGLGYVDDDAYGAAQLMASGLSETEARIEHLQTTLDNLRASLVKPMAQLFGVHPDDLSANLPESAMIEVFKPAEQQPVSWIRIRGDKVILSRCDWMYPASTEDSAGPRDEQRFAAVGRRDGDIVLSAPEGALDREDLKTMLAWSSASKPAEQSDPTYKPQPAPDVAELVEALEQILGWRELRSGREFPIERIEDTARNALATYRKGGEL